VKAERGPSGSFGWKADIAPWPNFWLSRPMRSLIFAAFIALSLPLNAASPTSYVTLGPDGNVTRFYGIPINLTVKGLKRLPYRMKVHRWFSEEAGEHYTSAKITAEDGVVVEVAFDSKGKLYEIDTWSPKAVDPKGIRTGTLLSDVRAAWPKGKLTYGYSIHGGAFVVFSTGSNVSFSFDYKDMPRELYYDHRKDIDIPNMPVHGMQISTKAYAGPETCLPGYCL